MDRPEREARGRRVDNWVRIGVGAAAGAFFGASVAFGVTAYAAVTTGVIRACVQHGNGQLRVIGPGATCKGQDTLLEWNAQGQPGPRGEAGPPGPQGAPGPKGDPGTFSGTFASPSGQFRLSVTDAGITLEGPSTRVRLDVAEVEVDGVVVDIAAAAQTQVDGGAVQLGGACPSRVVRSNDVLIAPPDGGQVAITTSSNKVFAC